MPVYKPNRKNALVVYIHKFFVMYKVDIDHLVDHTGLSKNTIYFLFRSEKPQIKLSTFFKIADFMAFYGCLPIEFYLKQLKTVIESGNYYEKRKRLFDTELKKFENRIKNHDKSEK